MTGQFLSVDPDVASTGQPYVYAGNDPPNSIDPLGLDSGFGVTYDKLSATTSGGIKITFGDEDLPFYVLAYQWTAATDLVSASGAHRSHLYTGTGSVWFKTDIEADISFSVPNFTAIGFSFTFNAQGLAVNPFSVCNAFGAEVSLYRYYYGGWVNGSKLQGTARGACYRLVF